MELSIFKILIHTIEIMKSMIMSITRQNVLFLCKTQIWSTTIGIPGGNVGL
jgi:hypothetical protein